ncbi:MAG: hypothetical protein ACXWXK_08725, partial [Actinomycetota bacterium]
VPGRAWRRSGRSEGSCHGRSTVLARADAAPTPRETSQDRITLGSRGVGFGLAVRHQVAAIAGALIWMLTVENMLSAFFPDVMRYFPGQLGASLTGVDALELLAPADAAAALAGWATLATVTGAALMRRRDIA